MRAFFFRLALVVLFVSAIACLASCKTNTTAQGLGWQDFMKSDRTEDLKLVLSKMEVGADCFDDRANIASRQSLFSSPKCVFDIQKSQNIKHPYRIEEIKFYQLKDLKGADASLVYRIKIIPKDKELPLSKDSLAILGLPVIPPQYRTMHFLGWEYSFADVCPDGIPEVKCKSLTVAMIQDKGRPGVVKEIKIDLVMERLDELGWSKKFQSE